MIAVFVDRESRVLFVRKNHIPDGEFYERYHPDDLRVYPDRPAKLNDIIRIQVFRCLAEFTNGDKLYQLVVN